MWSDLFLALGGVINWNAGDVLITHSANTLAFTGASSGYTYDAAVLPSANDAAALGASGTAWADLFLASGGVINWNAADVTITHSANALAFAGASSGYTFDVPIGVASGGTGLATLTANNVILGNGTSAPGFVAPSTSGNVLTSNGTTWTSAAAAAGGQPIPTSSTFAVGSLIFLRNNSGSGVNDGATVAGTGLTTPAGSAGSLTSGGAQTGTWTNRSGATVTNGNFGYFQRTS